MTIGLFIAGFFVFLIALSFIVGEIPTRWPFHRITLQDDNGKFWVVIKAWIAGLCLSLVFVLVSYLKTG